MPELEVMNHKLYHEIIIRRSIPYAISTNKNAYVDDSSPVSGESLSHTCETFNDTSIIPLKQTHFMQAITIPRAFTLHYFKHNMDHIFLFTLISSVLYLLISEEMGIYHSPGGSGRWTQGKNKNPSSMFHRKSVSICHSYNNAHCHCINMLISVEFCISACFDGSS